MLPPVCCLLLPAACCRPESGGVGWQFWSVYVPASRAGPEAVQLTLEQIDVVHRLAEAYADTLEMAYSAEDVRRIFAAGKIASMCGIEVSQSACLPALNMSYR